MKKVILILAILLLPFMFSYAASDTKMSLEEYHDYFILDNGLIELKLSKQGDVLGLTKDGINIVKNLSGVSRDPNKHRSFYLDFHTGISGGATNFYPSKVRVLEQNEKTIHIAFIGSPEDHGYLEYHYVMRPEVSGVYNYVIAENINKPVMRMAELRTVYRFDSSILNQLHNGHRHGPVPLYSDLEASKQIQDETWRLDTGEIYTKYDYATYMRESKLWGVFGNGLGAWVIPASFDYYAGDLLNQELMVHQDAIALNYLTGAHLGSPDMFAPQSWKKTYGPWLVYVNHEDNEDLLIQDAFEQTDIEQKQWPYRWMKDTRYALDRGTLKGKVTSDEPVMVVLSSDSEAEFDQQTLGYFYSANVEKGRYEINNINPGKYHLSVYALTGNQIGVLYRDIVDIETDKTKKDILVPSMQGEVLWHVGQANRRADEFKYSNMPRNYIWKNKPPANLEFVINESTEKEDWYFVQNKPGIWSIKFGLDRIDTATLNMAIAATSNSGMGKPSSCELEILINGKTLETFSYKNDKAVYRSANQSGRYTAEKLEIPEEYFNVGENTLQLKLHGGAIMYDTINLSRSNK